MDAALPAGGRSVRDPDRRRVAGPVSGNRAIDSRQRRPRYRRDGEESLRHRILDGSVSLRRRRGGRVRLDADAAGGIFGQRRGARGVRRISLLPAAGGRTVPRRVVVEHVSVAGRARPVQRQHPALLRAGGDGRRAVGGLHAAAVGPVHVDHLSDNQLEGNQLPAESRTRRRRRRDSVLHVRLCRAGSAGHRRRRRRVRSDCVRLLAGHGVRRAAVRRPAAQLGVEPDARRAGAAGPHRVSAGAASESRVASHAVSLFGGRG